MKITAKSIDDLPVVADAFIKDIGSRRVFAFDAPMGAGKTTFISEVCRRLGVADDCGSPTFSIVNEYAAKGGVPVYHFDFYRVKNLEEAIDIGIFDYFESGALCLMEWPDRIEEILPDDTVVVRITPLPDGSRTFSW